MSYFSYPPFYRSTPPSQLSTPQQRTVTVEGRGKVNAVPDQAIITIGFVTENEDVNKAQAQNARITTQGLAALKEINIQQEDIQTVSYIIQPIYEFTEGSSILKGYKVQHTFEITVKDLNQVGKVYEAVVAAGANIADNIEFVVSNKDLYYQQALQLAIKNATEKASSIGQQLGVSMNTVPIKVTENSTAISPRDYTLSFSAEATLQAAPPIQRSKLEIEAIVTVVYPY
ncbi:MULTISPECIES: SIMPL domain-containing protein [Bacillaceae]|uniref:SIMPL domain-containing protein n=1 Tax=Bacillaceae TaxID=186817 RepID=UPI000BFD6EB8|nr:MULTISPECIES: SIMPL domain-containing protein [Bacillaceae]PGT91602.1 SIMPL domain-containing protein [Bacillus sp. AFS040349]UGB28979.1 SIMPL domain-containing protein [Metabacillus sp. B2-18]